MPGKQHEYSKKSYLSLWIVILLAIPLFFSCKKKQELTGPVHKVFVFNSFSSRISYTQKCMELYEKYFHEAGVNVEIRHVELGSPFKTTEDEWHDLMKPGIDSVEVWDPEVIIFNDDEAMLMAKYEMKWIAKRPIVFGGLTGFHKEDIKTLTNMTGFYNEPEYDRNLRFISEVTGYRNIVVELDYSEHDSLMREDLYATINRLPFKNDALDRKVSRLETIFPQGDEGSIRVIPVSAEQPYRNVIEGTDSAEFGKACYFNIAHSAKFLPHLQIKYDVYSDMMLKYSRHPQFTCINKQFNDPVSVRFVGGYFTSVEDQIKDEVEYAVKILNGTSPDELPISVHHANYYMDYRALEKWNLNYEDWMHWATIENVPYRVLHPGKYYGGIAAGIIILILLTVFIVQFIMSFRGRKINALLSSLNERREKRKLLFGMINSSLWTLKDGVFSFVSDFGGEEYAALQKDVSVAGFRELIHPDQRALYDSFVNMKEENGHHALRLNMSLNGGKNWHWMEMVYQLSDASRSQKKLSGFLVNIDQVKQDEEQLIKARETTEGVDLKELFLANMSHDIRTPLNSIVGFSELLEEMGDELDEETRQQYAGIIQQNSEMLLKLVDDVVQMRSNDVGNFKFYPRKIKISELINLAYQTNRVLAPGNLEYKLDADAKDGFINVDMERTQQVLNNFLSNSFKFTPSGSVTLGWKVIPFIDEVEMFVQDTGVGISIEKQVNLFNRYYKTDEKHIGTGLGLNICKDIVEQQGGRISMQSELDKGSRFSVFFRMVKDGKEEQA